MFRAIVLSVCTFLLAFQGLADEKPAYPSFGYDVAVKHEIKPHRRTVPIDGVRPGFNQLRLSVTVSPAGEVLDATTVGNSPTLKFWPQLKGEVMQWKFTPFEKEGKAITAQAEEYIDLVPPEVFPAKHVAAPVLRPDSRVAITLERSSCFGSCAAYTVTVSTEGIVFEGVADVVAIGKHTDTVAPDDVRRLAKRFVDADFYSMDDAYHAGVTDMPSTVLSISIDGRSKKTLDYVGQWVGMPAIIKDLEDEIDEFARTKRWIASDLGLVQIAGTPRR